MPRGADGREGGEGRAEEVGGERRERREGGEGKVEGGGREGRGRGGLKAEDAEEDEAVAAGENAGGS